jgi:hypothetical protein
MSAALNWLSGQACRREAQLPLYVLMHAAVACWRGSINLSERDRDKRLSRRREARATSHLQIFARETAEPETTEESPYHGGRFVQGLDTPPHSDVSIYTGSLADRSEIVNSPHRGQSTCDDVSGLRRARNMFQRFMPATIECWLS